MTQSDFKCITGVQDSNLLIETDLRIGPEWPEFMLHDPVADLLVQCLERLPEYQFVFVEDDNPVPVAIANSIPLLWEGRIEDLPDEGWDWALTKGIEDLDAGRTPNILCALQIVVFGENRGRGISQQAVTTMKQISANHNLNGLIAPVRPNMKSDFPDTPIAEYIKWENDDGQPFDPWLRVHHKVGGRIIKPCNHAMNISGTISEWQEWTRMRFPKTGDYVVPGALIPVNIDIESDKGLYIEPNVWVHHAP